MPNKKQTPKGKAAPKSPVTAKTPKKPAKAPVKAAKAWVKPKAAQPAKKAAAVKVEAPTEPLTGWDLFKSELPSSWDGFLSEIASGSHMAAFCKARDINYTTMLKFAHSEPSKSEMYARAREDRADILADEIVAISDEAELKATWRGEEMVLGLDAASVSRNKLRVDARKWAASKLKPRTYGEKLELAGTVNHQSIGDEELLKRLGGFGIAVSAIMPRAAEDDDA
ncbi:MAG: hypothetical protein ACK5A0_00880 [Polaromonas sp.]|jgi:hypothetical protein